MMSKNKAHSSEQFGEQRDYWWNADFLDLLASRWELSERSSLLDVGCGLCHWSRLLLPRMARGTRFVGVDYEERWIAESEASLLRKVDRNHLSNVAFYCADAHELPFEADQFDVVTCQTVLMHLREPDRAVAEMRRVLKPGGLIVCIEPNNFLNYVSFDSLIDNESLDEISDRYKLWLAYRRGRRALGLGDNAFGEYLVGTLKRAGFMEVEVCLSDKARPMVAPYPSTEEQAWIRQLREWRESREAFFDREEVLRLAINGGATPEFVEAQIEKLEARFARVLDAMDRGTYTFGGGCITYIAWGEKQ
jgi:ubiquinone/menaquinone biosynthesis C-methylase UbiE